MLSFFDFTGKCLHSFSLIIQCVVYFNFLSLPVLFYLRFTGQQIGSHFHITSQLYSFPQGAAQNKRHLGLMFSQGKAFWLQL